MPAVNRIPAFTDAFPSSISASYDNGPGDWSPLTWSSSSVVRPSGLDEDCQIVRNDGNYGRAQWAQIVGLALSATGYNMMGASVLHAGGANEACYFGAVIGFSGDAKYKIIEIDNSFSFVDLAAAGTGGAVSSGAVVTTEVDEFGVITLFTAEGGADTQRVQATDATLTSGRPGANLLGELSTTASGLSQFSGGTRFAAFGDYLVGVGPYTSGTGNITPLIPTIETDAADYYPLLLAHCPGGQNIVLGTANGFTQLGSSPSATGATTAGVKVAAFGNTSGAGGSDPIITDPGDHCGALIALVWHPDGQPVVDATGNNQKASASTSFSISGVTTTVADALVLPVSGRDTDSAAAAYSGQTNANLTGLAKLFDAGTTQGNGGGLGIFAGIKSSAGATGATTGTVTSSINANYKIAFAPFTAGSVELVVADCAHGHAADGVALTQASTLSVGEAVHAHVANSVALSQGFTLAVGDAVHAHAADAPALTQANVLDTEDSVHGQHSDQPDLTQAGTMDVADSAHAQATDAVALIQANVLAIADSIHAQASDSPVLSQSQLLVVGDSAHAIITEALELTQANVLAVESAVHAHIADGIDLSTSGSLAVGSSAHGHFADGPQLVQASILTIGESVHTLVSAQIALTQGVVMAVQDAMHAHVTGGVTLSHGAVLAVASAVHLHAADAIDLTQATTIVVSDSVHAHIASQINLLMPGGLAVPPGRTIVVQAQNRVILIQPESRTFRMH